MHRRIAGGNGKRFLGNILSHRKYHFFLEKPETLSIQVEFCPWLVEHSVCQV